MLTPAKTGRRVRPHHQRWRVLLGCKGVEWAEAFLEPEEGNIGTVGKAGGAPPYGRRGNEWRRVAPGEGGAPVATLKLEVPPG